MSVESFRYRATRALLLIGFLFSLPGVFFGEAQSMRDTCLILMTIWAAAFALAGLLKPHDPDSKGDGK